ncbi:hypothetical protein HOK021_39360 [Streptomyces hygroscopicus]|nr:hypothetical protein HOK021_39360 [Streptomyces hygroscopicus]
MTRYASSDRLAGSRDRRTAVEAGAVAGLTTPEYGEGIQQRHQLGDVVSVAAGQGHGERKTDPAAMGAAFGPGGRLPAAAFGSRMCGDGAAVAAQPTNRARPCRVLRVMYGHGAHAEGRGHVQFPPPLL